MDTGILGHAVGTTTDNGAQRIQDTPYGNAQAVGHLGRCEPVTAPARKDRTELGVAHPDLPKLNPPATTEDRALAQQIHAAEVANVVAIRHRNPPPDELLATGQHASSVGSRRDEPRRRGLTR